MNSDIFFILLPAILFSFVLSSLAIPMGLRVISKGIIFLDIAIAQISVLGSTLANLILPHYLQNNGIILQLGATLLSIVGAIIFYIVGEKIRDSKEFESLIGITYIFSATLTTFILAITHISTDMIDIIFSGKLLFLTYRELSIISVVYVIILLLWLKFNIFQNNLYFYIAFAIVVSLAMPIVGIYFMFSILIIPALLFAKSKFSIIFGICFSVIVIIFGAILSILFDYPSGLIIVILYTIGAICFYISKKILKFVL